jgi:hypothetical protein
LFSSIARLCDKNAGINATSAILNIRHDGATSRLTWLTPSVDWLQTVLNDVLAAFTGQVVSELLSALFLKITFNGKSIILGHLLHVLT